MYSCLSSLESMNGADRAPALALTPGDTVVALKMSTGPRQRQSNTVLFSFSKSRPLLN
jgi:hypothetical protein